MEGLTQLVQHLRNEKARAANEVVDVFDFGSGIVIRVGRLKGVLIDDFYR